MIAPQQDDFLQTLGRLFDGTANDFDRAQFTQHLTEDAAAQALFTKFVAFDLDLEWLSGRRPKQNLFDAASVAVLASDDASSSTHTPASAASSLPTSSMRRRWFSSSVLRYAAVVALCFYGSFVLIAWNLRPDKLPRFAIDDASVAVVRDITDVQWSKNRSSKLAESSILSGEPLTISSGTIELELKGGAKLVIEGPADWSVDGKNSVSLRAGKLLARVPNNAIGFTVETPTAKIVDLGTEFGVVVDPRAGSAVHVIKGEVAVSPRETNRGQATQKLTANQSIRVGLDSKLQPITFDTTPFATVLSVPSKSPDQTPREIGGLLLWLRADRGVELDAAGLVERWADQSGNHFDAVQSDPERRPSVTSGSHGASLDFDGVNDFLQCPRGLDLDGSRDGTVFLRLTRFAPLKEDSGIFSLVPRQGEDWTSLDGLAIFQRLENAVPLLCVLQNRILRGGAMPLELACPIDRPGVLHIVLTKKDKIATLRTNGRTREVDQFENGPASESVNATGYLLGARFDVESDQAMPTRFGNIKISHVLVYDRAITGAESTAIETYLKTQHP
jgi:hypothetical protein